MRYAVLLSCGQTKICLLKTSQYQQALALFTLLGKHGSIVQRTISRLTTGSKERLLVHISDDQELIRDISNWSGREKLINALREAELSPTKEYVIEGTYTCV